ncbi:MAG: hypothetical protein A3I24_02310 [Candidatus Harrisonbacteria bacterium RIFCSPLOWO2_02_FULL_41_13b]|uniref:GIY-YIG domain-containing protein n=1 Tax=Candidatus Harrisonbacteria bacterium RIFCSPLOWO2_02_FULL_41_13b TaxID=1798409 RepID=A0A1G1ZRP3_9BACT|nr:MAG: hypothetical protein A3J53_03345 [Candidatus Harrisonbacteria bacterium RIFCSPHIGHO2_02_FULL_40_20]OGY67234.1 MAG: hypothetical protein A3I24_02310 [Candidatus Harrisonbacteria bacterium RIFCSPLOWO2_02_FULL_41_13b]
MYYVYVLKNIRDDFYIGYTKNVERRLAEHQNQEDKSYKIVYYEVYAFEKDARNRERRFKYYGSAWRALKKRFTA